MGIKLFVRTLPKKNIISNLFNLGNSSNRTEWIDNSKGICMFFVILIHTGIVPLFYTRFIEPFFLSAFFILSGFLFHNPQKEFNINIKLTKIIKGILIPYFVYWIVSYALKAIVQGNFDLQFLVKNLLLGNKLWFMAALIVSQLFLSILLSFIRNYWVILCFGCLSIVIWKFSFLSKEGLSLPWSINMACIANFFLAIGYVLRHFKNQFQKLLLNNYIGFGLVIVYFLLVFYNYYYLNFDFNFPSNKYGNIYVFILYALIGSYALFFLGTKIRKSRILIFVGINSLLYYFFQNQVLLVLKWFFAKLGVYHLSYWLPPVMALIVIYMLIFPINVVNKYFPIMSGKYK